MEKNYMHLFKKGVPINILKINVQKFPNCMEIHREVLLKNGTCFFGRFGKNVSSQVLVNEDGFLLFYQHGEVYLSHAQKVEKKPVKKYIPQIYQEYFFNNGLNPHEYLRLDEIEPVDSAILDVLSYKFNGHIVSKTIGRCNNAFITSSFVQDYEL